jgi:HD-like signal output (HDOD) protein/CheY-like chemotaxis protein
MGQRLRILFVDDEPRLLEGLVRLLRPMRDQWEVLTAPGGVAGMAVMERTPADVVVSDMRMPEMDGAQFLALVATRWPRSIRFILSGQSDRGSLMRSIASTHQYLAKPCDPELLREAIERAYVLRERLHNPKVALLVGKAESLPSLPAIYEQIIHELQQPEPSTKRVAAVVAQDIGMSAKLLQLVNSARFGINHRVTAMEEVIDLLGIDLVRQLVLATQVFATCIPGDHSGLSSSELWHHSQIVAACAQALARSLHWSPADIGTTYTAGLLHDCGRLLLAMQAPVEYVHVKEALSDETRAVEQAETSIFGTGHPEAGAYLLGLWGLPDALVEAVAYHHRPSLSTVNRIVPLTLVHVAQCAVSAIEHHREARFDQAFLDRCQATQHLPAWQDIIRSTVATPAA